MEPTLLIGSSFLLSLVLGEWADRFASPRRAILSGGPIALFWRAWLIASIWLFALGLTARPMFASAATLVTIAILVAISNAKQRYLREPLVFSDVVLLEHAVRHPHLFYVPRRMWGVVLGAIVLLLAAIAGWMLIEPRAAGVVIQISALGLVAITVTSTILWPIAIASAAGLVREPDPEADIARVGLLVSLVAYFVAWRLEHGTQPRAPALGSIGSPTPYDAIIVLQMELFIDLRRHGRADARLPAFDRLKQRAISSGLLEVPCQGAYTLRPECAVITGLGFDQQGFDRFHPYMRTSRIAANALPRRLAEAGWRTMFVHPFDSKFFRRHRAMPALGFSQFADEHAFADAERYGPYISDRVVGEFLLDTLQARTPADPPLFAYAVTMEAHDPYGPGRLPGEDDPVRQYLRHLENADRMLARMTERLDAGQNRVLLVAFGDHVPFLPSFADPFADTRTDYVAVAFGPSPGLGAHRTASELTVSRPEHLHALILRCLSDG